MSGLKRHKLLKTNPIKKWVLALLAKNARDAFPSVSGSIQPTAIDRADFERKQSGQTVLNALRRSRAENAMLTATIIPTADGCLSAWFSGCFAGDWRGQVPCFALLLSDLWSCGIQSSYDVSATLSNFCLGSWSQVTLEMWSSGYFSSKKICMNGSLKPGCEPVRGWCDRARAPCTKDAEKLGDLGHPKTPKPTLKLGDLDGVRWQMMTAKVNSSEVFWW